VGGCRTIVSNSLKEQAIRDYLTEKGESFPDDHYLSLQRTRYENAFIRAQELIVRDPAVDAIITADAYTALAVYNVLTSHGFKVPEQVSIINFDNLLYPDICITKLSCIEQDISSIVNCTLQNLRSMIEEGAPGVSFLTKTTLILRDTTRS